jgi:uncharacterized protein (UPF0303 family)
MNAKQLFAVSVFALATSGAFAATSEFLTRAESTMSTLTRAEVIAQLAQARADGTLPQPVAGDFTPLYTAQRTASPSTVSRNEIRSEAIAAVRMRIHDSATFMQ